MPGQTTLAVEGMTCSHCEITIRKYLEGQSLENVSVSFANEEVSFSSAEVELDEIISGIEQLGYKVSNEKVKSRRGLSGIEKRFLATTPFTAILIAAMFVSWPPLHDPLVQLALCIPVFGIGLWHFGKSAWASLRVGTTNMDVLIVLGSTAAFGYSVWGTVTASGPAYLFYETAAAIVTLVLLGNVIEHRSVRQTTSAIRLLGRLQPEKANVILARNGLEEVIEVPASQLIVGDVVHINTGDAVSADGTVSQGSALVNESMITGESLPVSKQVGEKVVAGTLVEQGSIRVRVNKVGQQTSLARIIDMVKHARNNKTPMQKLADRISAVFVPVVIAVAIVTFLASWVIVDIGFTESVLHSVAVLVIACPCAMGLATPTAIAVGLGRSARRGILIRGSDTTQKLRNVRTIVFDKTGTLTTGDFRIENLTCFNSDETEVQSVLAGLERHSSHPIAKAIVNHLNGVEPQELVDVQERKGIGVEGKDERGNTFVAGSRRIIADPVEQDFDLYLTKNSQLIAGLTLKDQLKPDALTTIQQLNATGYRTVMLSGDQQSKCKAVAEELGISAFYAEQLPDQKLEVVDQLVAGSPTAMVGDGINDAPALARATVGISLSEATQVAIQSSEVILLGDKLARLPEALAIAKHTNVTVRQNLFWAFFYNVIAIPVAAVGLLSPMVAAFSMAFSDVMVIGNSLRLRTKRLR